MVLVNKEVINDDPYYPFDTSMAEKEKLNCYSYSFQQSMNCLDYGYQRNASL